MIRYCESNKETFSKLCFYIGNYYLGGRTLFA